MPKLSKNYLEKRFACQYCGNSFRTRQGLCGHIQFKHDGGKKSSQTDFGYLLSKGKHYELVGSAAGLPMSQIKARQRILAKWLQVQGFCDFLQIKLSPQDFKNYIIMSLAQQHGKEA